MGRDISLFANYHGKENTVTNYCGLMLKLVYNESPKLFDKLLEILFSGDMTSVPSVLPRFVQQEKHVDNIPDLTISLPCFQIQVETKLFDWYTKEQLDKYVSSFNPCASTKVLVLLSDFEDKNTNIKRNTFKNDMKNKHGIWVVEVTFQDLLDALEQVCASELLHDYLEEFRDYLDRSKLLPSWQYTLDVVNCGVTKKEVMTDSVYMCPDTGGQYHHKRAKYFGTYWSMNVEYIYEIDAVVSVPMNFKGKPQIKWNNSNLLPAILQSRAIAAVKKWRMHEIPKTALQVFLLSDQHKVDFSKDTPGGLYGSKIYFECRSCKDIGELEKAVKNKAWSDFPDRIIY